MKLFFYCVAGVFLLELATVVAERPEPRESMLPEQRVAYISELRKLYASAPSTWPAPHVDDDVEWHELGPIPEVVPPEDNPSTKEKIELGRLLFFDPRISGSGQIACASCHEPDMYWSDGRAVSFGHNRKQLTRNAPSLLNAGLRKSFFWDGRAESLESQAHAVITNPDEMHSLEATAVENLSHLPEYTKRFKQVFGDPQPSLDRVTQALAAFERTLVGGQSRFDYFLNGRSGALTDEELAGLHLFRTEARCMNCHHGPLMTDDRFHNVGLSNYGRRYEDLGRYQISKDPQDVGAFRTPSLRNVAHTAPYMHNGMFTLEELLTLYNSGMPSPRRTKKQVDDPLFPTTSKRLKALHLNDQDLSDLTDFLNALSEPPRRIEPPKLPALH
ncbi:MAG: cytochrome c peroxidase [Bythopirellula sp.]|nr:cytochrome c peroxidase [Bythopirellula sp.]